jgi:hypothetical protein
MPDARDLDALLSEDFRRAAEAMESCQRAVVCFGECINRYEFENAAVAQLAASAALDNYFDRMTEAHKHLAELRNAQ